MTADDLRPGDCLLYRPIGFFGHVISIKTWHPVAHVECYDDLGFSFASRDGQGVNRYPWRASELRYVLRPSIPLDLAHGRLWAHMLVGTPYGWWDLANFVGMNVRAKGIVCSPFVAGFYRACGWNVFPTDDINKVAPFQFLDLVGEGFSIVYKGD